MSGGVPKITPYERSSRLTRVIGRRRRRLGDVSSSFPRLSTLLGRRNVEHVQCYQRTTARSSPVPTPRRGVRRRRLCSRAERSGTGGAVGDDAGSRRRHLLRASATATEPDRLGHHWSRPARSPSRTPSTHSARPGRRSFTRVCLNEVCTGTTATGDAVNDVDQCNGSNNVGGSTTTCYVDIINNISIDSPQAATALTLNQCVGSGGGGGTLMTGCIESTIGWSDRRPVQRIRHRWRRLHDLQRLRISKPRLPHHGGPVQRFRERRRKLRHLHGHDDDQHRRYERPGHAPDGRTPGDTPPTGTPGDTPPTGTPGTGTPGTGIPGTPETGTPGTPGTPVTGTPPFVEVPPNYTG